MRRVFLVMAISAVVASWQTEAGTVAGFGGATEVTQLLNNAQLVKSYIEQVETALNSARQYQLMLNQLERNQAGFAEGMMSPRVDAHRRDVDAAGTLITSLESLSRSQREILEEMLNAYRVMQEMEGRGYQMDVGQYHDAMMELARTRGGVYEQRAVQYKQNVTNAQKDIDTINRIVSQSETMTTEIQGLQSVVASNAVVANLLMRQVAMLEEQRSVEMMDEAERERMRVLALEEERLRQERFRSDFGRIYGTNPK